MSLTDRNTPVPPHQPRVVIQFQRGTNPWGSRETPAHVATADTRGSGDWTQRIQAAAPGATIERLISPRVLPTARLQELQRRAAGRYADRLPELQDFAAVHLANAAQADAVIRAARAIPIVQAAYLTGIPAPPPINSADDPRAGNQGYLDAAPTGIDARFAWNQAGGEGGGITVVDLEQGWNLTHEDFPAGITLMSGLNKPHPAQPSHGTSVLGELVMQDNTRGGVGIVPGATAKVVSQWRTNTRYNTAEAILAAAVHMRRGDVLLLEAHTPFGAFYHPVECELPEFIAILIATQVFGVIVVEAAGNGNNSTTGVDLDTWADTTNNLGRRLRRGDAAFMDSGAIVVGAANSSTRARMPWSNYGSRVDCYAWGQNITTADNSPSRYTASFNGTSGASPIVTGAAVSVNAQMKARIGVVHGPADMRRLLTDTRNATASATPATDRIGVMPDLRKLFDNHIRAHSATGGPRSTQPQPGVVYAGGALVVDAGHGGESWTGASSAYGHVGPSGRREKDVAWDVAASVAERFGGAVLTRERDGNPSLRARAALAASAGAQRFLSIHADSAAGPEVWVYGSGAPASERSAGFARRLARALSSTYGAPVPVYAGPLATLDPSILGESVAGALVNLPSDETEGGVADGGDVLGRYLAAAAAEDLDAEIASISCGHAHAESLSTPWPSTAPAVLAPPVPTAARPAQLASWPRPAAFDKPARELTREEARDIVVWLCGQTVPGTTQAEITLMQNGTIARWPQFNGSGAATFPIVARSERGNPPICTTMSGVQYVYAAGGPAYAGRWRASLDLRMIVFAWRLAKWARETWGATHLYHMGMGGGAHANRGLDAHTEGRALDFSGIEGTRNGAHYRYRVLQEWGNQAVPGRSGGWGSLTSTTYRLAASPAPSAHAAFLDVYNFIRTQCVDQSLGATRSVGNLHPGACSSGFILHPDYPGASLRNRHQDHIHCQLGPTRDPDGNWP